MGTKVYLFAGDRYLQFDRGQNAVDAEFRSPIRRIASDWGGMSAAGFGAGVDAAVNWGDGQIFFFKDDSYVRYTIANGRVDDRYPLRIKDEWPGMADAGFGEKLDAAVNWGNGKAFFFKGPDYVRYHMGLDGKPEGIDAGYPLSIADHWDGLAAAGFGDGVRAAITWGDGSAFFFKGSQYVRFDIARDKIDGGARFIVDDWPGMKESGFGLGISAAVDLLDLTREIWLPGAVIHRATKSGPAHLNLPWRGILHTTEGPTLASAETALNAGAIWPHFTIEPNTLTVVQQMPLNRGSRAVGDATAPCNASHAVQIEIVGFAKNTPGLAPEQLAFIRSVMRQIEDVVPIPRRSSRSFLDQRGVDSAPSNRLTVSEWNRFSGWCGHQHVPGNDDRWDPGAIDIDTLLNT